MSQLVNKLRDLTEKIKRGTVQIIASSSSIKAMILYFSSVLGYIHALQFVEL